jgi:hypothetical protein
MGIISTLNKKGEDSNDTVKRTRTRAGRADSGRMYKHGGNHGEAERIVQRSVGEDAGSGNGQHLGYDKHSVIGNNSGNSRNGYGKKTIKSEWGESDTAEGVKYFV